MPPSLKSLPRWIFASDPGLPRTSHRALALPSCARSDLFLRVLLAGLPSARPDRPQGLLPASEYLGAVSKLSELPAFGMHPRSYGSATATARSRLWSGSGSLPPFCWY